ncbi:MAG: archaemetzincin [Acidobacteria bacterium]|nr:archaemetzincin [Acidobacteriota bacterium]
MSWIAVMVIGEVEDAVLAAVESRLEAEFALAVRRMPAMADPDYAFDPGRGQYSSVEIMKRLLVLAPAEADRVLGVTGRDIFIPMLSFLFGQAQLGGRIALVSIARLRQQFYGLPGMPHRLVERAIKESLHELGHTFGLTHCSDGQCAMSLSTNLQQVDGKAAVYCPDCRMKIEDARVGVVQE